MKTKRSQKSKLNFCDNCLTNPKEKTNWIWIEPNPSNLPILINKDLTLDKTQYWIHLCNSCFTEILQTITHEHPSFHSLLYHLNRLVVKRIKKKPMNLKIRDHFAA